MLDEMQNIMFTRDTFHWIGHFFCVFVIITILVDKRSSKDGIFSTAALFSHNAAVQKDSSSSSSSVATLSVMKHVAPGERTLKNVKVAFITGITGMIGSAVAEALHNAGGTWEIHGLVRWRSNVHNLKKILQSIHLHYGDIQDPHLMHSVIKLVNPNVIFHFAAQAYNGVSWASPAYTLQANIIGTLNILEPMRVLNMTSTVFVVAGSSTEYGHTTSFWKGAVPETAPLIPVTPYGVSKVATEMLSRMYFLNYHIPVIIPRFFVHVGTGHTENQAVQNFCLQVAEIEAGIRPPVVNVGRLDTLRDITDIKDAAPIIVKLAEVGVPGEAYNIASNKAISMSSILDLIISLSKVKRIEIKFDSSRMRSYDEAVLLGDNSKIRTLTGWVPSPHYNDTVNEILNFWRHEVQARNVIPAGRSKHNKQR